MIGRPRPVGASGSKIYFSTTDVSARPSSRVGALQYLEGFCLQCLNVCVMAVNGCLMYAPARDTAINYARTLGLDFGCGLSRGKG